MLFLHLENQRCKIKQYVSTIGNVVTLKYNGSICTTGILKFVGGTGLTMKWGNLTIGKGKSLVQIQKVTMPGVKPRFSYKPSQQQIENGETGYNKNTTPLIKIIENIISWPTENVFVDTQNL